MSPFSQTNADDPPAFVPRSLRHSQRVHHELRDARNRRVPPSLAGYRLRPNRHYALIVRREAGSPGGDLEAYPQQSLRLVQWEQPLPESAHRVKVPFVTRGRAEGGLQVLHPPTADLRVSVRQGSDGTFENLRIPISVHGRWVYALMLIPAGVVTWAARRVLPSWLSIVLAIVALAVLMGGWPSSIAIACGVVRGNS